MSREEQFQSGEQRATIDDTSILKDKSVGGYIFSTFFSGLTIWVKGKNNDGVFQRFSATKKSNHNDECYKCFNSFFYVLGEFVKKCRGTQ
jgi:hypothetical protein